VDAASPIPTVVDLTRPNAARVYDYYLGGSHNFAVDREMAEQAIKLWPELPAIIHANRAFLRRVVRYLVGAGIRQFIDLGSGIPTVGNVHEVARQHAPDTRVIYVDIDSVAVAHARTLLAGDPCAAVVHRDLRRPQQVLADPELLSHIDFGRPVAVLMIAVLHFVSDSDDPAGIIAGYRDALAAGSFLAVSHATDDGQRRKGAEHRDLYARTATPMTMRSHHQIARLLEGWELVDPGLVRMPLWRPDPNSPLPKHPDTFAGYAVLGLKSS